uniref:Uncharacterized protein n=1 Tax=viral metagenome TaxID=1070528 RepID=A0A6M3J6X0_9ZZZZ
MKKARDPLLVRVCVELGRGRIREDWIIDGKQFVDGYIEGGTITVNPVPATVDTVIHEILHRLNPEWKEPYVRNRTTYIMRRMSDGEIRAFYDEYRAAVTRQRRNLRRRRRPRCDETDAGQVGRGARHDGGQDRLSAGPGGTDVRAVGETSNG